MYIRALPVFQGHDSTAAGINWAIYLLGRHPDIQDRLHEEMERIFGIFYDRVILIT